MKRFFLGVVGALMAFHSGVAAADKPTEKQLRTVFATELGFDRADHVTGVAVVELKVTKVKQARYCPGRTGRFRYRHCGGHRGGGVAGLGSGRRRQHEGGGYEEGCEWSHGILWRGRAPERSASAATFRATLRGFVTVSSWYPRAGRAARWIRLSDLNRSLQTSMCDSGRRGDRQLIAPLVLS